MKHTFINYFKSTLYLLVFAGFGTVYAGSYDDFFHAVLNDQPAPVKRLLARGFDANTLDPKGLHGLYIALREPSLKVAQVLVDWPKTDVNKTGWTPLHYAATNGHVHVMNLLLEHHAYIDAESPNGTTPLMMAAHYGTAAGVKLLLEAGADPTLRNQLGMTAIDFANKASRTDAAELIAARQRSRQPRGKW